MAAIQKSVDSSSLAEVIDRILDKGVVIDLWARVSLVGIELLTVDARIVIASVDTWLKYAKAVGLLKDHHHHPPNSPYPHGEESGLESAL
ncbi:MAG: gas vesicle structural protein GvpA [Bacillus sp. (in: firmicutes)]